MVELKIIEHNTLQSAEAEQLALYNKTKHLYKGATIDYTDIIKHPTLNKWATKYKVNGAFWDIVAEHLNPNQINNLITPTSDWFINEV